MGAPWWAVCATASGLTASSVRSARAASLFLATTARICKCDLSQTVKHQVICTGDCCAAGDWIRVDRRAKKWKGVEEEFEE